MADQKPNNLGLTSGRGEVNLRGPLHAVADSTPGNSVEGAAKSEIGNDGEHGCNKKRLYGPNCVQDEQLVHDIEDSRQDVNLSYRFPSLMNEFPPICRVAEKVPEVGRLSRSCVSQSVSQCKKSCHRWLQVKSHRQRAAGPLSNFLPKLMDPSIHDSSSHLTTIARARRCDPSREIRQSSRILQGNPRSEDAVAKTVNSRRNGPVHTPKNYFRILELVLIQHATFRSYTEPMSPATEFSLDPTFMAHERTLISTFCCWPCCTNKE